MRHRNRRDMSLEDRSNRCDVQLCLESYCPSKEPDLYDETHNFIIGVHTCVQFCRVFVWSMGSEISIGGLLIAYNEIYGMKVLIEWVSPSSSSYWGQHDRMQINLFGSLQDTTSTHQFSCTWSLYISTNFFQVFGGSDAKPWERWVAQILYRDSWTWLYLWNKQTFAFFWYHIDTEPLWRVRL